MSDDFKHTANSATSVVDRTLEGIRVKQRIDEVKTAGGSPTDAFNAVFDSEQKKRDLAASVCIVNLFAAMGKVFGLGDAREQMEAGELVKNRAFLGFSAILQHYVDSASAKRFEAMFISAETNGDVWRYFLAENEIDADEVKQLPGYEEAFFSEWLEESMGPRFALNRVDYEAEVERARKSIDSE